MKRLWVVALACLALAVHAQEGTTQKAARATQRAGEAIDGGIQEGASAVIRR